MATSSTLPPILRNGTHGTSPTALAHNHPRDPRYSSPNAVNGNPPPGHQPPPSKPQQYLPPLQPQSDPRSSAYPPAPPDQRGAYCNDRRPPYRQEAYSRDPYYTYCRGQPPPSRPPPPNGLLGYRYIAADVDGYPPIRHGSSPPLAQAAPRQRASIACRYCRKKKSRCSGSNSHPGGKCQNCARENQECIFQPTSSSMLFIPVSAMPGGVPPGAQVFVAYGQPLAPGTVPAPPPPHAAYQHSSAPPPLGNYYAPVQSHTESSSSCGEAKTDNGSQLAGRQRRGTSKEQDEGYGPFDFKNAFVNAEMDEEIYTTCPPGYGQSGKVWRLLKALYGLHDLLIIAQPEYLQQVNNFKAAVHSKYEIKDLGEAISFLNIRILRDVNAKKLWICQDGYINKLGVKFGIDQSMRTATPLTSSYRPQSFEGQATIQQITEMQEKVGSILYAAVVSRPDISYAASQLSQHAMNPSPEHLRYANRVLSYLQTTQYYAIEFSGSVDNATEVEPGDDEVLQQSSDASFADDPETRKSTQGYLMKLFSGAIMWQSSKQKTVTTSTTEAELLSLSHTARETIALYRLFEQIQFDPQHQPRILCDNQQTVGLVQKERPQLTSKLKHIDIHNFWLRQIHKDGKITVQWVSTTDMPADGFTKPLSAEKHSHFVKQLGLVDISSRIDPEYVSVEDIDQDDIQISSDTE
ncbi:hypothetical protein HZS61_006396 [Fusarium oxysporum f. sp. conglutinans]|uniref:Zn(2)-C6 fungal-type domain-containing protein n=1 Tax=Fusarium oxysporum f. sp. conglutinans TaxID=100902 RepID=A0A8H6GB11_FUSOX|nr:hypothetical protein HZS61_006396 [Fusarium oxysporum f. sp. conglutinans]